MAFRRVAKVRLFRPARAVQSRLDLWVRRHGRLNAAVPLAIDRTRGGYFGRTWFRMKCALLIGRGGE